MFPRYDKIDTVTLAGKAFRSDTGESLSEGTAFLAERRIRSDFSGKKVRKEPPLLKGTLPPSSCQLHRDIYHPNFTTTTDPGRIIQLRQWPGGVFTDVIASAGIPNYPSFALQNLANSYLPVLLAKTNPGAPVFSVPVFIRELVDIPDMFRLAAKGFYSLIGGGYLNYKFGWLQFVQDVKTLFSITQTIEKRIANLSSLTKHGGLRKSIYLDTINYSNSNSWWPIQSTYGHIVYGNMRQSAKTSIWGHVRWLPTKDLEALLAKVGKFNLAVGQVFDLEAIDSATMWNLIPWTWLVDFFIDIGSWLGASEDSEFFTYHDACVTFDTRCSESLAPYLYPGVDCTDGSHRSYTYTRIICDPLGKFPSMGPELLTKSQVSILLALLLRFSNR